MHIFHGNAVIALETNSGPTFMNSGIFRPTELLARKKYMVVAIPRTRIRQAHKTELHMYSR